MAALEFKLLGDFRVLRNGEPLALPASRKTRALLAYLVVTGRPQRRERLCELFWEIPDDPRAALRWSLSKLRPIVNDENFERLTADRERVTFARDDIDADIVKILRQVEDENASNYTLTRAMARLREEFLGGVDLPDQSDFSLWLASERERVDRLRAQALARLIAHPDTAPDLGLDYARQWMDLQPFSREAADAALHSLRKLGRERETEDLSRELSSKFADAGLEWKPDMMRREPAAEQEQDHERDRSLLSKQEIRFCQTADGVTIAYASVGAGPPLVKAANWLTHLELDWNAPIWSPLFRELARDHTFIRYDERGNGLSDWDVPGISMEAFVTDLETVVDALGIERFPLLGISQGAAVSIEYASRHPERVSKLILFGGYPKGWRVDADEATIAEREAVMTLTKTGWGQDNPAYRHIFSATFMPGANPEQLKWFDDFQRQTTCPENAVRFLSAFGDIDVSRRLSSITVPTLVLHSRGDRRIPWETGRDIAATIPNAQFVTLDSNNHLLLEGEPAAAQFVDAVRGFLDD